MRKCHCGKAASVRNYYHDRALCDMHARVRQMRLEAKAKGKRVPTKKTLEAMFVALGRDMTCSRCYEPMVFYRADDHRRVVSLQHEPNSYELICASCNAVAASQPKPPEGHKRCPRCGETKPFDCFYVNRRTKIGLTSSCKGCNSERSRAWREKNPERHRANHRRWVEKQKERHSR